MCDSKIRKYIKKKKIFILPNIVFYLYKFIFTKIYN